MKTNKALNIGISELNSRIREYINKPRILYVLKQDSRNWNQISSSLDVIGDTHSAITSYLNSEWPDDTGLRYIYLYGLLQAMFLQQDAVKDMSKSLEINYPENEELKKIRDIRNDSIGHPTNRGNGKSHHFISQASMHKDSFTLMSFFAESAPIFEPVNVSTLIEKQMQGVTTLLKNIMSILEEKEMKHKEKFSNEKLVNLFPATTDYYFQKMFEGIHASANKELGVLHLNLIHDLYKKLIEKLKERGEYPANDVLVYKIKEILYPIQKLADFFDNNERNNLNEKDAHIFASFVFQKHSDIVRILDEIDQEYESGR